MKGVATRAEVDLTEGRREETETITETREEAAGVRT